MAEGNPVKSFYVQLPGYQQGEVWDEEKYNRNKEQLFKDHQDAMVVETSPLAQDEVIKDDGMFTVKLPGYEKGELWDGAKLNRNREQLLKDHPDAVITKTSPVNYWGDKLNDISTRIDALENELKGMPDEERHLGVNISDADALDVITDTPERRRRNQINAELDQLRRERESNPAWQSYWDKTKEELRGSIKQTEEDADISKGVSVKNEKGEYGFRQFGSSMESDYFKTAKQLYKDALKTAEAPSKYDDSLGIVNFAKGAAENIGSAVTMLELAKAMKMTNVIGTVKQIQEAEGENVNLLDLVENQPERLSYLSPGQREMMKAFIKRTEIERDRAGDMSIGYKAGAGAIQSLGFMGDFLLTGGAGSAAGKAVAKKIAKETVEDIAGKTLTESAKKMLVGNIEGAVKSLVMTPLMPSSYSNFLNSLTQLNSQGGMDLSGKAVLNSIGDTLIETFSENAGELFGIPFEGKLFDTLSKSKLGEVGKAMGRTGAGRLLKEAGWHGMAGEMAEEVLGNAMRTVTGIDENALKDFFSKDEFLTTLASFAPMTIIGAGASMHQVRKAGKNMASDGEKLQNILRSYELDEDQIKNLLDVSGYETPEQLGHAAAQIGRAVLESGNFTPEKAKEFGTALGNYVMSSSKYKVLQGVFESAQDGERARLAGNIDANIGDNSWYHQGEEGNYVRTITDAEGNERYVVTSDEGQLALVGRDGSKSFLTNEELEAGIADGSLTDSGEQPINDYLDGITEQEQKTAEEQRMTEETATQLTAIQERIAADPTINMGTEEAPKMGVVDAVNANGVHVTWQDEDGAKDATLTWEQVGNYLGTPVETKTDEQIEQEEIQAEEDIRSRKEDYNKTIPEGTEFTAVLVEGEEPVTYQFKRAFLNEDGTMMLQVVDKATGKDEQITEDMALQGNLTSVLDSFKTPAEVQQEEAVAEEETPVDDGILRDFRGNPIPLKDDGSVNQTALWNADPEAWAKWNDSQRNDGGVNSRGYIAKATKKLQSDAKAVQKQIAKELDFDKIENLEGQLASINSRIADLERIENNYANAEVAQVEAVQTPEESPAPVAETTEAAPVAEATPEAQEEAVPQTPEQVLDSRLAEAKTPEEKRQALEEYYAAIGTEQPIVATRGTIREVLESIGCSEATIDYIDGNLEDRTQLVEGFRVKGRILIIADDIRNAQRARLAYVHERQHTITSQNGYAEQLLATMPDATEETLLPIVNKASGANYAGATLKELADEIVSLGMEIAYDSAAEDLEENLRSAGLDVPEIINFVKTIDDEQRRNGEALSLARRDRTYARNYTEASQRQDGGDSATRPEGILGEQGSGSEERSIQGAGEGGLDTSGNPEVTPTLSLAQQGAIDYVNGDGSVFRIARLDNKGIAANGEEVRFSVRYSPQESEIDRIAQDIADQIGVDKSEAERWVRSETSLAAIITGQSAFLDYEGDDRYTAIKQDSDYPQGTVDFNNICRKRLAFTEMYQRVQKAFPNTIITGEDLATIRNIMKNHDLMVACGLCYVEDRRQLLGEIAKDFIDNVRSDFGIYESRGGETKKKNAQKFRNLIGEDKKEDLSIYDLITLEGSAKLLQEHPGLYQAFQAFYNARGQQSGNLFQGYAEYKREILKWNKKKVKSVNDNGGLRVFSYSDFEAHHLIDLVQIIQDCARKGVKIQGYTKVPAFARAVANTGLKLNRSLIPLGDTGIVDGKLAYDSVEGIDINDPNFLPSNDNIGNILIGINDEQIRLAMADPFIHFIIPYHSNQKDILRSMKQTGAWTNYKLSQTEKDASGKTAEHVNIYTDVLNAAEAEGNPITNERQFTEKFLEVCKERGLTPRFAQFLDQNENGDYVYTPGYYKFLVDFKLFDEQGRILPQEPVRAEFDDGFNAEILNDYVKEERAKLGENLDDVYNEIVDKLGLEKRDPDIRFRKINDTQKQPVSDAVQPVVTEEDIMFRLSKNNKATVESWLKKREDINDEQREEVVDYIDKLDDAKTQLATAKWFANGTIRIPEDMKKVQQAISVAGKAKVDPLRYNSPMELLDAHADFKPSEERINPDEVSTLHRAAEYPEGIVVYDVDNTKESRENMRKIINTHFGEDASPWCLLQGDGKGNLTESSAKYWKHYNAYPKQVAFKDGKLLAFSANDTHTRVWWDRQDQSHYGIPLTKKVEGDELGRSADYIVDEGGKLIIEPGGHMYRGNQQNGVYEEWNSDGSQLLSHIEYKDGKEDGISEEWYPSGQIRKRAVMKEDRYAGTYEQWYDNGQQKLRDEMNEEGDRDGEQVGWYRNGNKSYEWRAKEGKTVGDHIQYYETGEPKFIQHYDEEGTLAGYEDYVSWRAEKGIKAHIGIGRRVAYAPGDSNRRTEEEFRANGRLHKREEYHGSKLDGIVEYYYPDGTIQTRTHYVEGERNGTKEVYHENGKLWLRGDFKDGEVDGLQEQWNKEGDLILREEWKDGKKVRTLPLDENVQFRKVEPIVDEKNEELFEQAKKTFGTTNNLSEAGYVLPDGTMLDFSGRHLLDPGQDSSWMNGMRQVDHREITDLNYEKDGNTPSGYETDMRDFIRRGAIRLNSGVINLATKPTRGQENVLWGLIQRANGDVDVDFGDGYDSDHYASYNHARPERILNDIRRYFDEGIEPEGNVMFRKANQTQNGFISNAQMALDKIKMDKATPEQWIKMLEKEGGMKAGEDKWLGLSDWLKESDKKTLTKDEVGDFIEQNRIQIEEQHYSEAAIEDRKDIADKALERYRDEYEGYASDWRNGEVENSYSWPNADEYAFEQMVENYGDDFRDGFEIGVMGQLEPIEGIDDDYSDAAKYFLGIEDSTEEHPINDTRLSYSNEELENKREIALTVPTIDSYYGSLPEVHFADQYTEGRVVAWIRFGDATSVEGGEQEETQPEETALTPEQRERLDSLDNRVRELGLTAQASTNQEELDAAEAALREAMAEQDAYKREIGLFDRPTRPTPPKQRSKVLVIDEIQSQRHQDAREKGYKKELTDAEKEEIENAGKEYKALTDPMKEKYGAGIVNPGNFMGWPEVTEEDRETMKRAEAIRQRVEDLRTNQREGVPAAPFEKNWHELAMKRMLRLAAEEGYDKIAWTTGDQQAERYNLGGVVNKIESTPYKSEGYNVDIVLNKGDVLLFNTDKEGTILSDNSREDQYVGKNLSDVVGKDIAKRILDSTEEQTISGDGLRVGGEGMRGFYDDILPRFMNKYGKKWGVKVGTVALEYVYGETGRPLVMHSVDVTPEMKESVMEGQVMFRKGQITPEQDKEYMDAVNAGDMDKAQQMVREAARLAMSESVVLDKDDFPKKVLHGTNSDFNVFDEKKIGTGTDAGWLGRGFYFYGNAPEYASQYGKRVIGAYLNIENPYFATDEDMNRLAEANSPEASAEFRQALEDEGYDGVFYNGNLNEEWVAFYPNQIKSAEPVTYDNNGEVIPLSERFNEESDDIRFSLRGIIGAENAEDEAALDNLEVAEEMENAGKDSQTIWRATGWERGADGKWRNEIPDAKQKEGVSLQKHNIASEVLDAPELFASYPQLAEIPIDLANTVAAGAYNAEKNRIVLDTDYNTKESDGQRQLTKEGIRTILHELQHAIQHIEGFVKGTNAKQGERLYYRDALKSKPEETYFAWFFSRKNSARKLNQVGRSKVISFAENYDQSNLTEQDKEYFRNLINYLKGISDDEFKKFVSRAAKIVKAAEKAGEANYEKSAGEVEARNVERRSTLSDEKRQKYSPEATEEYSRSEQIVQFRKVTDPATLERLESEPTIKVYRAMQEIDGQLYPPMAAKVEGKMQEPIELGVWEEAVERPDLADAKGNFTLNKGNGKSLKARYNPYIHTSRSPLNDQFTSAYDRPNLVTVEVEVPESELTSGYKAEKAKDSVGEMTWHAGPVSSKLPEEKKRKVILSRWDKPIRIVPDSEVADRIAELLEGEDIAVPYNTVTPSLREELEKRGVQISDTPSGKVKETEATEDVLFRRSQDLFNESREGGLTRVIGDENATELYHNVYRAIPKEIRERIVNKAGDGFLFSEATRDAIAEAVENGDPTGLAGLASNMLRDYVGPLDERTARYILWRGDRKAEDDDLLDTVKDITMQRKLQVGQFADPVMFRLSDNLEEAEHRAESMANDAKATMDEKKEFAKVNDALTTIKAMSLQKEYDRKTVNTITVLAKNVLKDQSIETLSRHEIARLLGIITTSIGKAPKTVKKNADALVGLIVDHLLRSEETKLGMLANTKASKTNQAGVEVQGALDVRGQNVLKAYKAGLDMDLENPEDEFDGNTIKGRLNTLSDRLSSDDDAVRSEAEDEYAGLMLAQEYQEKIKASINEERGLKNEMKEAAEAYRDGNMSRTGYNQFVEEAEKSVRENKIERIEAYRDLRLKMLQMMEGSIDARKEFTEREKQRVEEIHHLANSDMQGEDASPFKEPTRLGRFANSSIVRFFSKPLITFDQMLRLFGQKNVAGEGYLFNKFHRGWIDATEKAYLGDKQAKEELDAKVSEVFDKKMRWSDLYAEERKMPTVKVKWWDGGQMKEHELTQGNLLYIYMVNKMTDGRMKLRRMGITDEHVDAIKKQMDERFIELADWLQGEYLVNKRNKYNAVHERLFGASMAAIEDYFPLKINKRSLNRAEDIGRPEFDDALPATTTGSIIKRKRNAQDLDLLGADAFSVVIEHIEQMEQWAAFAEFNKDLNTLLSYKRFRNQVQNMDSVYGSGNELWKNFKSVCRIAGGTYNPAGKKSDLDTAALNIAKGVTSAKISFRIYTALKQFLSMPAFVSDANPKYLAQNLATPWKAWNWAMENLPMYEKRWKSRMVGDTRLMNTESDWKLWRNKIVETLSRLGMSPNAFVDAMTIAIGSHSMYQTRYDRYIQDGYTEEQADKKAKQDATTLYNETQQSNEAAFVSPVQLDRTVLATMLTVFRNSSMGYQRQLHDAIRNIGKMMKPGYKAASIEFMTKQMVRDGLTEEQAEHAANRSYNREIWRSAARIGTFGFLVQFAWNLGGSIAYLLFGDDDDKKEEMLTEALIHGLIGGSMEGLAGGNVMSEALNMVAKGESLNNYDPSLLPIISDMKSAYKKMSYNPVAGSYDILSLLFQSGFGVNPQTLSDAVVAVVDACGGDLDTATEAMMLFMRVLQVPQSQVDQIYIDELGMNADKARSMSPGEMAERYARYKINKEAGPLVWAYSDEAEEKREKAYLKRFKKLVKERKESK